MFLKLISFQWEEESEYFVQFWKILKHKVYLTNSYGRTLGIKNEAMYFNKFLASQKSF